MAEKRQWIKESLIAPVIAGAVIAAFTFILPKWLAKGKELSYTIDGPINYFDQQTVGNVVVAQVKGVQTQRLFIYKVRIWNSGEHALKELPARFGLVTDQTPLFELVVRETNPKNEFGGIKEEGSDGKSKRFIFALLNPGDEVAHTFVSTEAAKLTVDSKSEDMRFTEVPSDRQNEGSCADWRLYFFLLLIFIFLSLLILLMQKWFFRTQRKSTKQVFPG